MIRNGIYYLGPKGSFSHEAALKIASSNDIIRELGSISDIFSAINRAKGIGVVPIENSIEGPVNETLDNLYSYENIYVNKIIQLPIRLVLASSSFIDIKRIKRIYSHFYAYKEAQKKLSELGITEIIPVESTSKAAFMSSKDPESAAICSEFAARLYNLKIIVRNLQDGINITKFAVISKKWNYYGKRTMIFFTVPNRPGSLYRVLEIFYKRGINLTMIYSRPLKSIPWEYYFYVEYEGRFDRDLFNEIRKYAPVLKIKGSYNII